VPSAIRELSVGLCRGTYYMYRAAWGFLAQVTGHGFRAGADRPTGEVVLRVLVHAVSLTCLQASLWFLADLLWPSL
jgi:hypothetical protein